MKNPGNGKIDREMLLSTVLQELENQKTDYTVEIKEMLGESHVSDGQTDERRN